MLALLVAPSAFADRAELQAAVDAWLANATAAEAAHGHISDWDTSSVNSTAYLFMGAHAFNANLSGWDTSKVVTMQRMFHNAASFDGAAVQPQHAVRRPQERRRQRLCRLGRLLHVRAHRDARARAVCAHQGDGGSGDAPERDVLLLRRRRDRVRELALEWDVGVNGGSACG